MVHVNKRMGEISFYYRVLNKFLPEYYYFRNIDEFHNQRDDILTTSKVLMPVSSYKNGALLNIINPLTYSDLDSEKGIGLVSDLTGELRVSLNHRSAKKLVYLEALGFEKNFRMYFPSLIFRPGEDTLILSNFFIDDPFFRDGQRSPLMEHVTRILDSK